MKKVLKKIFPTHYLINSYIKEEYEYFGTDNYNEDYMNFLWDSKLNLHLKYIFNIFGFTLLIIAILK